MRNLGMNQAMGISVMPETILYIGGEAIGLIKKDYQLENAEELSFGFMVYLKENIFLITKNISDMYAQAINNISLTTAHDLALEHLYSLAVEVLDLAPKKSPWEMLKEEPNLTPTDKAIIFAIESANNDELSVLQMAYPAFVAAYKSSIA